MKVIVDKEKCFMSGECYYNHPELFRMYEDGYPEVIENRIDQDLLRHAEEAVEVCPAGALKLEK